ncbi:hypothetical protein SEA_PUPPER_152 [Gordonia phage Pupper]|uniref:Uncharacterized protein n=1 Tax=Gordonia phage Pupper TaxID=2571249 RepID=A0A4Y6EIS5_9CAUD|nr:hypothetical protein KHQ83_gp125 [Gordonia phage Pupper]QDF18638.1 hypothetical protein SEA_PUPPER_152 [Gordonia phage Pupper]QDF18870.1 hypothetical protein SEA_SCENTAE_151 [Gordonia phage SCentae]
MCVYGAQTVSTWVCETAAVAAPERLESALLRGRPFVDRTGPTTTS